jgi:MarR family transcriptional regulator, 2-MHQ and catechol-resistance regulon repressor
MNTARRLPGGKNEQGLDFSVSRSSLISNDMILEDVMPILHKGPLREVRALDAYVKLMRAANCVTAKVHRHLGNRNLTVGQLGVLDALHHLGPLSLRQLAGKNLMSPSNITMVVDNLEKRGLVERRRESPDRRIVEVRMTQKGTELFLELFPTHVTGIVEEMAALTESEQEELSRLCKKLGKRAQR